MIVIPFYLAGNLLLWVFYVEEVACEDEDDDDDSDNANIWVLLLHLLLLQCFVQSFSSFSESSISSKALVILLLLLPSFLSPLEFSPGGLSEPDSATSPNSPYSDSTATTTVAA